MIASRPDFEEFEVRPNLKDSEICGVVGCGRVRYQKVNLGKKIKSAILADLNFLQVKGYISPNL